MSPAPRRRPAERHLLDPAPVHDGDPVAHGQRLLLVVGHVDERDPDLLLERLQLDLERLSQLRVERAQRLVQQQHRRVQDERPGERDPLLLAARELRRLPASRSRSAARARAPLPTRSLDLVLGHAWRAGGRRRRCRTRSGAGTARSSGTRCSRSACAAACTPCRRRRAGSGPRSGCSNPAIIRSVVVLPQPDGPSIEKNSPPACARSMPSTAVTSPNRLTRSISCDLSAGHVVSRSYLISNAARRRRPPPAAAPLAAGEEPPDEEAGRRPRRA